MTFYFKHYVADTLKYDFLNKFNYENISSIPSLISITLHFKFKNYSLKLLVTSLSVLEIITGKKGFITKAKISNITLKLRKGSPIGCKVVLRKKEALKFLSTVLDNFKNIKNEKSIILHKDCLSLSNVIPNVLSLPELESNYHFFKNLGQLNIKFTTTAKTQQELDYLLKGYKLQN